MPAQRSQASSSSLAAKRSRAEHSVSTASRSDKRPGAGGAAARVTEKDDDELELESFLFGRKKRARVPPTTTSTSKKTSEKPEGSRRFQVDAKSNSEEDEDEEDMQEMADDELFQFDSAGPSRTRVEENGSQLGDVPDDQLFSMDDPPRRRQRDSDDEGSEDSDEQDDDDDSLSASDASDDDEDRDLAQPVASSSSHPLLSRSTSKKAAWHDPADDRTQVTISNTENSKLKKLIRGDTHFEQQGGKEAKAAVLGGKVLEGKLREQFERMHPTPEWASKKRSSKDSKSGDLESSSLEDRLTSLFSNTAAFSTRAFNRGELPQGTLDIDRQKDANAQMRSAQSADRHVASSGGVMSVKFHPSVGALAVVGSDRRLRMYSVDGHTNPPLLSLHIPPLPLTTAHFHPSGTSIFLGGPRPFFYTYDLPSQRAVRSPKNLFGVADTSNSAEKSFEKTSFSPDGTMLAVAGRKGSVYVLAWGPAGAGQLVGTFNRGRSGGIRDLVWMRGGRELWVLGEGNEIDVWDVVQRSCARRWQDQGGYGATMLRVSRDERYCAVGSSNGVVNVYDAAACSASPAAEDDPLGLGVSQPAPLRELLNLTTAITTMAFNHDSQILLAASNKKKDALRMFHLPSATAFTNWPTSSTPLGQVTTADFSSGSEYVAIGNTRGKVLLYSLKHYHA